MILGKPKTIGGGKVGDVWLSMAGQLLRARQSRFEESYAAHSNAAAMFRQLLLVNSVKDIGINPDPRQV